MDFDITSNGELSAYKGLGGDVRLPEECRVLSNKYVFDHKTKARSLYLPKGFLGVEPHEFYEHLLTLDPDNLEAGVKDIGSWSDVYRSSHRIKQDYLDGKVVRMLEPDALPSVERFEVHPDNIAYAVKDGLLYTKDFKTLIACPAQYKGKVVLHDNTDDIEEEAFRGCTEITDIVLGRSMTTLNDEYDPIFNSARPQYVRIIGLDIDWLMVFDNNKKAQSSSVLDRAVLIFPKYDFSRAHRFYKLRLAMGYCISPDSFSPDVAKTYTKFISNNQAELISLAYSINANDVIEYFDKIKSQAATTSKSSADTKAKKVKKLPSRKATLELEYRVCYGTDEDVEALLKNQSEFALTARALGLACRYGSLRKVELISKISDFDFSNLSNQNNSYFGTLISGKGSFMYIADYSLWSVIDHFREKVVGGSNLLAISKENEIARAKVLPESERAEIIKYLAKKHILKEEDVNKLYYYSLLYGNFEIAKILQDDGASLKDYQTVIEGNDKGWRRKEFNSLLFVEHPDAVLAMNRHAKDEGINIKIFPSVNLQAFFQDQALFSKLIAEVDVPTTTLTNKVKRSIVEQDTRTLSMILATGRYKAAQLAKFITLSIEEDANECTSILMDYKNSITSGAAKPKKRSSLSL